LSAEAPQAVAKSRVDTCEAGQAALQVDDIHQALKFATRPAHVGWHGYAGAVDEECVVGGLRDLVDLPQQAWLHSHVTGYPLGPHTGPRTGPQGIAIVESHCRRCECGCVIEIGADVVQPSGRLDVIAVRKVEP